MDIVNMDWIGADHAWLASKGLVAAYFDGLSRRAEHGVKKTVIPANAGIKWVYDEP